MKIITNDEILDTVRTSSLFDFAFAVFVCNLTNCMYRFVLHLTTSTFELLELNHGIDLFWPLTTDDLKPFGQHLFGKFEIVARLLENVLLVLTALLSVRWALNLDSMGLITSSVVFLIHIIILVIGFSCFTGKYRIVRLIFISVMKTNIETISISPIHNAEKRPAILTLEFFLWFCCLTIEILSCILMIVLVIKSHN